MVEDLALAGPAFAVEGRAKGRHWLLAGPAVDAVGEVAPSFPEVASSGPEVALLGLVPIEIVAKVVDLCLFVGC